MSASRIWYRVDIRPSSSVILSAKREQLTQLEGEPSQGFPPIPPSSLIDPTPPSTPTTPDTPDGGSSSSSSSSSSSPSAAAISLADVRTGYPCKGMHDETDAVLSVGFLNMYRKEICNGCQIKHPSQCQHECLEETSDYFYEVHYHQLMQRLWTDRFIPTIQRALNAPRLCVSQYRIRGACDFLLHDFKTIRCIDHSIAKIYNTMTEGDEEKIEIVDQALEFWLKK
ncbi:hypothetical protein ABVT39_012680 [Epinephelus coioides]